MKPAHPSGRRRTAGFTLLELLIATVVAAFVLIVINSIYFTALRLNNSTQDQVDRELVRHRAVELVRRDVAGLMVPQMNPTAPAGTFSGQFQDTPTDSPTQDFNDTRVSPDFYTTTGAIDGWSPFSEVQVVSYFLAAATDGSNAKNLVRAVTRNLLPVSTPTTDEQTLLTGVADAAFSYYDGTEWTDTWDSTTTFTLPAAIKFTVNFAAGRAGPAAPPIELVLPVDVSTSTSLTETLQGSTTGGTL